MLKGFVGISIRQLHNVITAVGGLRFFFLAGLEGVSIATLMTIAPPEHIPQP